MYKIEKFLSLLKKANHYLKGIGDLWLLLSSRLFNRDWYLANNPDVANAKVNPFIHYLHYGGFEGRDPSPKFSSAWYLNKYDDVKQEGINPLIHYLKYGKKEGRKTHIQKSGLYGSKKQKVFCIGLNKTGTTSMELILKDFGYILGDQAEAEHLMDDWAIRDFRQIVKYCETADAFQDLPFSVDFTYQAVDYAFQGSKFILTVRNNADEWYQSMIRFHSKIMGTSGLPTIDDLKKFSYREKGWNWRQLQHIFGIDESNPYSERLFKMYYTNHNRQIMEYFKYRPNDLLVLNLANPSAMQFLCDFLDIKYEGQVIPHLNKSSE